MTPGTRHDVEDLERLRTAFAAEPSDPAPGGACPDPDRLWAAARGELAPAETRAIVEHVAACPACTEDWRLAAGLGGLAADSARQPGAVPRQAAPVRRRPWRLGVLAAAAALVLVAGLMMRWGAGTWTSSDIRGPEGPVVRSLVPASAPLPRDAALLRWELAPAISGARFGVRVTNAELVEVAEASGLARPEYLVPAAALAGLAPGGRIYWRVEAEVPGGGRVRSATFTARIR